MSMNDDIKEFPIFRLMRNGELKQIHSGITSVADYNHYKYNLHHFIQKQSYKRNKKWYEDHGIKQKLILIPIEIHEQLHFQGVNSLSDDDFEAFYHISRWKLIFNRRYSEY